MEVKVIEKLRAVYFADCMFSGEITSIEQEWKEQVAPMLKKEGIEFKKVTCSEAPPFDKLPYEVLFFDWGGMSMGNGLLGSFCRQITREAADKPNTFYVMTSSFTQWAMEDALDRLDSETKLHNVFLNIPDFATFYLDYLNTPY